MFDRGDGSDIVLAPSFTGVRTGTFQGSSMVTESDANLEREAAPVFMWASVIVGVV